MSSKNQSKAKKKSDKMSERSSSGRFLLLGVLLAIYAMQLLLCAFPGASGCQKEVVVNPDAICVENAIESKAKIYNDTDQYCNQCYCIKGEWKCEIKKCGCYPGAPIHIWMNNVRYGCFCTLEGILNKTDCTPEWFSIRKGRSVPSRLQYKLQDLELEDSWEEEA